MMLTFYPSKIDIFQIDTTNRIIVGRFIIDATIGQIDGGGPLGSAGYIRSFSQRMLNTDGNIEIIQDMKTLKNSFDSSLLPGCRITKKGDPYKT